MKKTLLCCILLLFTFTACTKKTDNSSNAALASVYDKETSMLFSLGDDKEKFDEHLDYIGDSGRMEGEHNYLDENLKVVFDENDKAVRIQVNLRRLPDRFEFYGFDPKVNPEKLGNSYSIREMGKADFHSTYYDKNGKASTNSLDMLYAVDIMVSEGKYVSYIMFNSMYK